MLLRPVGPRVGCGFEVKSWRYIGGNRWCWKKSSAPVCCFLRSGNAGNRRETRKQERPINGFDLCCWIDWFSMAVPSATCQLPTFEQPPCWSSSAFHFSSRRGHQLEPSESKGVAQPVEPLSHGTWDPGLNLTTDTVCMELHVLPLLLMGAPASSHVSSTSVLVGELTQWVNCP